MASVPLLEVRNLHLEFYLHHKVIPVLSNINFSLKEGEVLGLVGESGSGKTQTAFAVSGLTPDNGSISGSILFEGKEILHLEEKERNKIRAKDIAMVFQDPMTALNPFLRIEKQMTEVLVVHKGMDYKTAFQRSLAALDTVHIVNAKQVMRYYPHEISGGMQQRIMIAMALLNNPKLLIADEPTTALDATVQAQILNLLAEIQRELSMAIILITHNLSVTATFCSHVLVLYAGHMMEYGCTETVFQHTAHPYTESLLKAIPRSDILLKTSLYTIEGGPPDMKSLPAHQCVFYERCSHRYDRCKDVKPTLFTKNSGHQVACFLHEK